VIAAVYGRTSTADARGGRQRDVLAAAIACSLHAALALVPVTLHAPADEPPPLEVALAELPAEPPDPMPAPPEPLETPEAPEQAVAPRETRADKPVPAAKAVAAGASSPARAAPAEGPSSDNAEADAPVESGPLVFDDAQGDWELASGGGSGLGVGATAPGGGAGGNMRGLQRPLSRRTALAPTARSGRAARVVVRDGCAGYFPKRTHERRAEVVLRVSIAASGAIEGVLVASELPRGEGFAAAARACLTHAEVEPASDPDGRPLAGTATLEVRFVR
jgi:hypothetical protein